MTVHVMVFILTFLFSSELENQETFERRHLTHLQLEESSLLLHLLSDLSSAELGANHPVLLGVLPLLLLNLRTVEVKGRVKSSKKTKNTVKSSS